MIFNRIVVKFYTIFLIILARLTCATGYNCGNATTSTGNLSEKLRCQLFSKYDSSISSNATFEGSVQTLELSIFYADIDFSGIFRLIGEARATWEDRRLAWDSGYYNTYSLDIRKNFHQIWKPNFTLINNIFRENEPLLSSENYNVTAIHNGTVTWLTEYISIQTKCNITTKNRPWVKHTCRLNFKTSSANFTFTIRNGSESSSPEFFNNSTVADSDIKSPWTVQETRKIPSTDGERRSFNYIIDVELHRNMSSKDRSTEPCASSYPSSYEAELRCYLFSNSDLLSAPSPGGITYPGIYNGRPKTYMRIYHLDFNIEDGILQLTGEIRTSWYDGRMTWDPEKFGGVTRLNVKSDSIWKPSTVFNNHILYIFESSNKGTFGEGDLYGPSSFGILFWMSSMNLRTRCNVTLTSWPWDPQNCALNFTINTPEIDVEMLELERGMMFYLDKEKFEVASLWRIIDIKHERDYPNVNIKLTFEMENRSLQIVSCVTFVAVSLLTLSSFLIPPTNMIKLASKVSSLLILVVYMVMLMNSIPDFASRAPNFLIGFVLLLLVVAISSCVTAYLVRKSSSYHPALIMKSEDSEDTEDSEESRGENDTLEIILSDDITSCDGDNTNAESVSKKYQDERSLKIATVVEYSSFSICSILVIILTMSFMI